MICSETTESMIDQRQGQSSASLAESSTITESSSSESAQSIQPSSSVPSSESTIIGPTTENESNRSIDEFSSDQRNVIDSWMNNGESNAIESSQIDDQDLSSCPPAEFPTTSIIDDEMTPTSVISTTHPTSMFDEHENPSATISTDEDGESLAAEQPNSPSHTVSSSNGHETVRFLFLLLSNFRFFWVFVFVFVEQQRFVRRWKTNIVRVFRYRSNFVAKCYQWFCFEHNWNLWQMSRITRCSSTSRSRSWSSFYSDFLFEKKNNNIFSSSGFDSFAESFIEFEISSRTVADGQHRQNDHIAFRYSGLVNVNRWSSNRTFAKLRREWRWRRFSKK